MATQVPPISRKKARLDASLAAQPPVAAEPSRTVVAQFRDAATGALLGPSISLPADTDKKGLEMLVNRLKGKRKGMDDEEDVDDGDRPWSFSLRLGGGKGKGKDREMEVDGVEQSAEDDEDQGQKFPIHASVAKDLLEKHPDLVSPEDVLVIECEPEAIFRVREVRRCSSSISGHSAAILCASFSPTGNYLATGSGDSTCRIWDLNTETPQHQLSGHTGWLLCVEWDGFESLVATGSMDSTVRVWDPKTGKLIGEPFKGHKKWITSLAWEPIHLLAPGATPRLASASKDGTVRIQLPMTKGTLFTLGSHTASVNSVKWSGEGIIYTASSDRTVKCWDGKDGKLIRTLDAHAHWVNTLALNTDFILRTGAFDHTGKISPTREDARLKATQRYKTFTSTTPELLISGSDDHTLFLWSPLAASNPKKPIARLTGHQKQVNHVAFSPDGRMIASAGFDGHVKLWEGKTGKFIASLRGHVGAVYRVSWSCDSRMLVSASKDSTLKLWDLKTFKIKVDLPGHTDEVYCVDFVADKVASGGKDKVVKIWRN